MVSSPRRILWRSSPSIGPSLPPVEYFRVFFFFLLLLQQEIEYENGSGSGGINNGSDEVFDPASSKGASGDGVTNNGSNENGSNENGSNGDEGTSSVERTSVCASADTRGHGMNGKGSSRDSCSSGAVSGNGNEKETPPMVKILPSGKKVDEDTEYKLLTSVPSSPPVAKKLKVDVDTGTSTRP